MGERRYSDESTYGVGRLDITLSREKLSLLEGEEELAYLNLVMINEHLSFGATRGALVVCLDPPVVAAYTGELDCVALLDFPYRVAQHYGWAVGDRLITVNLYESVDERPEAADLWYGPEGRRVYRDFFPLIADLLSDDTSRIEERKAEIGDDEWTRIAAAAEEAMQRGLPHRDGRPRLVREQGRTIERWNGPPQKTASPKLLIVGLAVFGTFASLALYLALIGGWPGALLFSAAAYWLRPRFLPRLGEPTSLVSVPGLRLKAYPGQTVTTGLTPNREGYPPLSWIRIAGSHFLIEVYRVPTCAHWGLRTGLRIDLRDQFRSRGKRLEAAWNVKGRLGQRPAASIVGMGEEVEMWNRGFMAGEDAIYGLAVLYPAASRTTAERILATVVAV